MIASKRLRGTSCAVESICEVVVAVAGGEGAGARPAASSLKRSLPALDGVVMLSSI
jgi:hypothetical protein